MNNENVPSKEGVVPVVNYGWEMLFIVAGLVLFYMRYEPSAGADAIENFLGYVGGLLGAGVIGTAIVGYIPYQLIKNKVKSPALKAFSVAFFLVGLLMFVSK